MDEVERSVTCFVCDKNISFRLREEVICVAELRVFRQTGRVTREDSARNVRDSTIMIRRDFSSGKDRGDFDASLRGR